MREADHIPEEFQQCQGADRRRRRTDHPVACDAVVAVRITLPETDRPIEIERAIVGCVNGVEFGLEFQSIGPRRRPGCASPSF